MRVYPTALASGDDLNALSNEEKGSHSQDKAETAEGIG
jgi:hypothetical protein